METAAKKKNNNKAFAATDLNLKRANKNKTGKTSKRTLPCGGKHLKQTQRVVWSYLLDVSTASANIFGGRLRQS